MSHSEILVKLNVFFAKHTVLTEEYHVVYLMVCIRKILDHEGIKSFPLTRFYCDWTVHTDKGHITDEIRQIMEEVYKTAKSDIERPSSQRSMSPVMQFAYMENLQNELKTFFSERRLQTTLGDEGWLEFIALLVKVLENQPILKPIAEVEYFSFIPAADRCVAGVIEFRERIKGQKTYKFANAY